MKLFSCQSCRQILFFESVQCIKCGHTLAYLPDRAVVAAIEPVTEPVALAVREPVAGAVTEPVAATTTQAEPTGVAVDTRPTWRVVGDGAEEGAAAYRLCRNYTEHAVCNWAVPASEADDYCRACRLNHVIPNLSQPNAKEAWQRLEVAKRRVLYTLFNLGLPVEGRDQRPQGGLTFDFLQDPDQPNAPRVFTGHDEGLITINIAEADDPFREKMRVQMQESYRTVLGHFRHEIGHYYWDRLIRGGPHLERFRALFGDETADYAAAQQRHYGEGAPADWILRFVSTYASMHPWEDWAETWAHYMHMVDTLETARAYGLSLRPATKAGEAKEASLASRRLDLHSFEDLMEGWIPLTMVLNSLNRSMGTSDGYPFVLSEVAVSKLRFVHEVVEGAGAGG